MQRRHLVAEQAHRGHIDALAVVGAEGAERGDGLGVAARRHDHLGVRVAEERRVGEGALEVLHQQRTVRRVHRPVEVEEGLVQAHRAHGQRHRRVRRVVREQRELDAAAADVDEQRAPSAELHRVLDGHEHEAGLLDALDDLEGDAGLALGALHEQRSVLRFAEGARCDGAVGVGPGLAHHVAKALEGVDGLDER